MNLPEESVSVINAYQAHQSRQHGILLCKKLIDLTIEIQKHRGCTLAILSGDYFFETQLFSIQRDITHLFQDFDALRREFLTLAETQHIMREWICLRRLWRKDSVQENFLLHSNLVSELLKLIWLVVQRSGQLGLNEAQDALSHLCFRDWLTMIETAAQSRGLATHIAVSKTSDNELRSRLRFLNEQMTELNTQFLDAVEALPGSRADKINRALERADYLPHLQQFQASLNEQFIEREEPDMDADNIYTQGSHVVRACHSVLIAGIHLLERVLSPELEAWVYGDPGGTQSKPL